MDGETFDRLSVGVHRLRERVTRRGALGVLLGGTLAAVGLSADETDARRRRRKKKKGCKGFGGRCSSNRDCCNGRCQGRVCFPNGGGGGGGGNRCNGQRCPDGWECCQQWASGVDVCVPRNHPSCFNNGECPFTWDHCGWNGPIRECCSPDQRCCDDNFGDPICISDFFDCDDFFDRSGRVDGASAESDDSIQSSDPIPVTEIDPAEFE